MYSLVEAALIVATLVIQSTAMAITSDQLTYNTTATTITVGDQLKFELRRERRQATQSKFTCVQIIVDYEEPDDGDRYTMSINVGSLDTAKAESSFALHPGKFTVEVRANVENGDVGGDPTWTGFIDNCNNFDDPSETGNFRGKTGVIDFYAPAPKEILVVLLNQNFEGLGQTIPDDLFNNRFAPVFTKFEGCPSARVGKICSHSIEVSTLNPAHGEVPDNAIDGKYYVQFDHVQQIEVSSATYKSTETSINWNPLDTTNQANVRLTGWFFGSNDVKIGSGTGIFQNGATTIPTEFAYRGSTFVKGSTYVNNPDDPFQTKRVWNDLQINPSNLVLLEVTITDDNGVPVTLTTDLTNVNLATANGGTTQGVFFQDQGQGKSYILVLYAEGYGNPTALTLASDSLTSIGMGAPNLVASLVSKVAYPGTLDYQIKAYGNELDPAALDSASVDESNYAITDDQGAPLYLDSTEPHNCDVTPDSPEGNPKIDSCATSTISLSASITNAAEVRIGAVAAHNPEIIFDASAGVTHADTQVQTFPDGVKAAFAFDVEDADFTSQLSNEEYNEEISLSFEVKQIGVLMPSCADYVDQSSNTGCKYLQCPKAFGDLATATAVSDPNPDNVYRTSTTFKIIDDANKASNNVAWPTSTDGSDLDGFRVEEGKVEFQWRPRWLCTSAGLNSGSTGKHECSDDNNDYERRLYYFGTTYCQYSFEAFDNTVSLNGRSDIEQTIAENLDSGVLVVMVRAHPYSSRYINDVDSYLPPVVTFSSLAFARISKTSETELTNMVVVEHSNVYNDDSNDASIGAVVYCDYGSVTSGIHSLGLSTVTVGDGSSNNLCCETLDAASDSSTAKTDGTKSTFTFTMTNLNDITSKVAFSGMGFTKHSGAADTNEFFKLCIVVESTLFPHKEVAILLDNSIEYGDNRRSARQQGDDSAEDVELPATQIFLDLAADGVLTVSFDDQQQPVISVEPNDEVVPQEEVSTTSPQLEDENNTTEQITTTLLGLIIGAVLILLVIVVIAVMMLNKRKEAAAKVYPFWMPGTDVTKTTVQA